VIIVIGNVRKGAFPRQAGIFDKRLVKHQQRPINVYFFDTPILLAFSFAPPSIIKFRDVTFFCSSITNSTLSSLSGLAN